MTELGMQDDGFFGFVMLREVAASRVAIFFLYASLASGF
jgi:hypothetical protein